MFEVVCPKYDGCLQCMSVHNHQQQVIAHPKWQLK